MEIAALYHTRAARVFTVMDDNLLPLVPDDAEHFLRRLADALRREGVGPIALSLQLRADVVTPAVADALVAVGLVRAYVGIDGYSRQQLVRLGRNAPADAGARALATLSARGVFAVCNALLVGPTIPLESIRAELEAMRAIRARRCTCCRSTCAPEPRTTPAPRAAACWKAGFCGVGTASRIRGPRCSPR